MWSEPMARTPAATPPKEHSMQGFLKIEGLSKDFSTTLPARPVFADVSFTISKGEFVCIIGHSGCGKTTILNVLAGLDSATRAMSLWTTARSAAPAWSAAWCSRATPSCPG
jgi:nitrate/nitrite transport system ATP-binding protein